MYIIAILKKTDSLHERMYMHNTNDIGIYLINDVVIFTFRKLGYNIYGRTNTSNKTTVSPSLTLIHQ